jgi:hypothetical protein
VLTVSVTILTMMGGLYVVLTVIVTITGSYICSVCSYCDNNDNNRGIYMQY